MRQGFASLLLLSLLLWLFMAVGSCRLADHISALYAHQWLCSRWFAMLPCRDSRVFRDCKFAPPVAVTRTPTPLNRIRGGGASNEEGTARLWSMFALDATCACRELESVTPSTERAVLVLRVRLRITGDVRETAAVRIPIEFRVTSGRGGLLSRFRKSAASEVAHIPVSVIHR